MELKREESVAVHEDRWVHWPVYWSAIWVGTLTALAVLVVVGLIGVALGAHLAGPAHRIVDWKDANNFGMLALILSVCGTFFAFVAGGWVAARVAGIQRSEPAMLHGAIAWLVAVPLLIVLAGLGAGSYFGAWYGGLGGTPAWVTPSAAKAPPVTQAEIDAANKEAEDAGRAARNAALGAVTALLLGLVGSVIGGWMASGEPMTFTHWRTRQAAARPSV